MKLTSQDLEKLSLPEIEHLLYDWPLWARDSQLPPDHPESSNHPPNQPNLSWDYWIALAGRGYGKALDISTPILTQSGWKTMGTLLDSDQVYAPDGSLTRIITHPILLGRKCYKLTFSDHTTIVADGDHLWTLTHLRSQSTITLPTSSITTCSQGRSQYGIPSTLPLIPPTSPIPLPIDPYLMGVWLGDGTASQGRITTSNNDLEHLVGQLIHTRIPHYITKARKESCSTVVIPSLSPLLRSLNLISNKHIPDQYLRAPPADRISLLHGLIDTDGCITKSGRVSFTTIYQHLALQFKELASSLGLVVQINESYTNSFGKKCHCYRVKFKPSFPPASNPRKLANYRPRSHISDIRSSRRILRSVEPVESRPVRCITVEHPSRLYLVTSSFISTHNTRLGAQQVLRWVDQGHRRIHIIAPTTADTRDVIVDGESGILNVSHPSKRPLYEPSKRRLTFPNGAIALLYSAEEPERLRGPQCSALWCDEIAGWQYPQETWDQAMFGLRLGSHPQVVVTSTPKPIPLIRSFVEKAKKSPDSYVLTTGSTYENRANLAKTFFGQVAQYEGTRLGRQELYAELIDPTESAIIHRSWLTSQLFPASADLPDFEHILQSYDTAFTEDSYDRKTKDPDPSASSTWGVFRLTNKVKTQLNLPLSTPYEYAVLLLDAWSDYLGYPELRTRIKKEYDTSYYNERRTDTVLIENKGSGISLRQDLQRNVPVRPYNPGRSDKIERLHAVSHLPCNGLVLIPESRTKPGKPCTWAEPFLEQLCTFPLVDHDDYVDTFSQAMAYLRDVGYLCIDTSDPDDLDNYVQTRRRGNPYGR